MNKKSQISTEYLIILGFVTFAVISVIMLAYFYSGMARDRIIQNQVEAFAKKIISSSEAVFYSGEPSKTYITAYLPSQVTSIEIQDYDIIITASASSGTTKQAFSSKVKLSGSLTATEGTKKIKIEALQDKVMISQA